MGSSVHMGRGVLLLLLAGLCAAGCGRRTILEADADQGSDEARDGGAMLYACGRGKRPCDPENLGGKTCESLGLGRGELGCNSNTCNFDLKDCTLDGQRIGSTPSLDGGVSGRGAAGTAGSAGTSGLFGGAAGRAGAPSNTGGLFGTGAGAGTGGGLFGGGLFGGAADGGPFGGGFDGGGMPDAGAN